MILIARLGVYPMQFLALRLNRQAPRAIVFVYYTEGGMFWMLYGSF